MVVDLLVATNQALKGQEDLGPTAQGEDQMGWMLQPFRGTLQGCLLLSESCGIGRILCARGPHLCQVWEEGGGYAGTLITNEGKFGEGNDGQWFKKRLSSPLGVHQGG